MPPLMSARTCWRAGWVVVVAGVVVSAVLNLLASTLLAGPSVGSLIWLYTVTNLLTLAAIPAGLALLVASVVLRRVEQLTAALVASGTIEDSAAGQDVEPAPERTPDGDVDLDVVDHEPGVR